MKKNFMCQEDFGYKTWGAMPIIVRVRYRVGQLTRMSVGKGRATRPDLKIGICGEQSGDPASVGFCYETGLTYASCSPFRVPIARLAAAQAAIKAERTK